jgi:hypothetical protein
MSPAMEPAGCRVEQIGDEGNEIAFCDWMSRDQMQEAWASLWRYAKFISPERAKERTAWILYAASMSTCKAE